MKPADVARLAGDMADVLARDFKDLRSFEFALAALIMVGTLLEDGPPDREINEAATLIMDASQILARVFIRLRLLETA